MDRKSQTRQQGFTLVELMAIVAIIGVISAIALPMYRNYVARTQHIAALADIAPGKQMIEINLTEGVGHFDNPNDIGLPHASSNCSAITVSADSETGDALISCNIQGISNILGSEIKLVRTPKGEWSCESTANAEYVRGCDSIN